MRKLIINILILLLFLPSFAYAGFLKADSGVTVVIGPFVDVGDGFTPETGITLGAADEAELLKCCGAATTDISASNWTAVTGADGWYYLGLTAGNLDTEGTITIVVQDDSVCLPVFASFTVVNANVYDSLYAAATTDYLQVDTIQVEGADATDTIIGADGDTLETLSDQIDAVPTAVEIQAEMEENGASTLDSISDKLPTNYIMGSADQEDHDDNIDNIEADTNELQTDDYPTSLAAITTDTNELQTDWTNGGRLDLLLDAALADTNELQGDWTDGGRLDLIIDSILVDTGTTLDDLVDDLETRLTATRAGYLDLLISGVTIEQLTANALDDVWGEVLAELGAGAPSATPSVRNALMALYMALRNKTQTTASELRYFNDSGTTVYEGDISDDGTTFEKSNLRAVD